MNHNIRKIPIEGRPFSYITDDSRVVDKQGAFLLNTLNKPYAQHAQSKGCVHFVSPAELWEYFAPLPQIVGVTGTNGKTTTTAAIYSILLDLGYSVALSGTRGFFINNQCILPKSLTTPPVFEIFMQLLEAKKQGCSFFIMEVSSHAIVQNRIEGLMFALKVLTNITSDHLDFHHTQEAYIAAKNAFFNDESLKLVNKDDIHAMPNPKNLRTYGIEHSATYSIHAYSLKDGISAQMTYLHENICIFSPLFGRHNLYNIHAAIASVHLLTHKDMQHIARHAENFAGVKGRMECVHHNPLVIIDFAHTEDGLKQIFESFLHHKIIVVFGAGGDRDRSKRPKMGAVAEKYAHTIFITNDNPRTEPPEQIAQDILSGITNQHKCHIELDRKIAIHTALSSLDSHSVLLILGKGDEDYQIVGDSKIPMNDAQIVSEFFNKT